MIETDTTEALPNLNKGSKQHIAYVTKYYLIDINIHCVIV